MTKRLWPRLLLVLAVLLAYGNTLTLDYALDDRLVIYQNDYTLMGWDGVEKVMTNDGFSGYFGEEGNLVAGGRYRPFTQLTFILEYECFGKGIRHQVGFDKAPQNEQLFVDAGLPFASHLGNIAAYLLLCLLLYAFLGKLFPEKEGTPWYLSLSFWAVLLFALHPIHTEAVANIKGRDEILSMLGGTAMLYAVLQYLSRRNPLYLIGGGVAFAVGIFSKENALAFLFLIPLILYFSPQKCRKADAILTLLPAMLLSTLFLAARYHALGSWMPADETHTILNDPFIGSTPAGRVATVLFTWGIYLKIMLFPHPLTHDYYPRQIEITSFANPVVILVLLFILFIFFYAIKTLKKKSVLSFAILFSGITFLMVSNLFINIGTFMNERFLFAPLLGFTLVLAWGFTRLFRLEKAKSFSWILLSLLLLFYTGKTISRNLVWENDFTLFTTDVQVSAESIKCNVSAGGSYLEKYKESGGGKNLKMAERYLQKAFALDSTSYYANLLLGETSFFEKRYDLSALYYGNAEILKPGDSTAIRNARIARMQWEEEMLEQANKELEAGNGLEALSLVEAFLADHTPSAYAYNLKGRIFGMGLRQMDSAKFYLRKALELEPGYASALENLGIAYAIEGDLERGLRYLLEAYQADTNNEEVIENIIRLYTNMGRKDLVAEWEGRKVRLQRNASPEAK